MAVLNLQLAAACAIQSPEFRMFAPVAESPPPYISISEVAVRSISNSPDLAKAFPLARSGSAAGFSECRRNVLVGKGFLGTSFVVRKANVSCKLQITIARKNAIYRIVGGCVIYIYFI
jgi:hypothetical protein